MTEIEELRIAAEDGDASAQYHLGKIYLEGKEIEKNYEKAANLIYRAADQNYPEAHNLFGYMHEKGIAFDIDFQAALQDYGTAAKLGSAEAMYNLARLYECEIFEEKDYDKAKMWYQAAVENGFSPAEGCAARVDNKMKAQWNDAVIEKLDQSYDEAWRLYDEGKYHEAFEIFFSMTQYSDSSAIAQMGMMIQEGTSPMNEKYSRGEKKEMAFKCYFDAAMQGNADAMFLVAQAYARGEGIAEDHANADYWIGKAAQHGNEQAQEILNIVNKKN